MHDKLPRLLRWFGALLLAVLAGEVLTHWVLGANVLVNGAFVMGAASTAIAAIGSIYGGYWLEGARVSTRRYPRVAWWWIGGFVTFTLLNVGFMAVMPTESWGIVVGWTRWAVAFGAGVGVLLGILEGRAIDQAIAAERATVRSEQLEEQRTMLDYLNSVLRHEVLNSANIIDGYATQILEAESELDPAHRQYATIIHQEANEMSTVIADVRVLLEAASGTHELYPVDLTRVLADEVTKLTNRYGDVEVRTDVPDELAVQADELLPRIFGNVLSNAVTHNDTNTPTVSVSAERMDDTVRVQIEDNGPGIRPDAIDSLFEREKGRGTTHGLGLYLVDELVSTYGGTVEVTETGPDGSQFTIELPFAQSSDDGAVPEPIAA
ncbi:ATP-binding protein [Saliphagus sp. GCM10025334]